MFTGIVEEIGKIAGVTRSSASEQLTIEAPLVLGDCRIGDSVSLNGVCLTVTSISGDTYTVDVMHQTLKQSDLGELTVGSLVNLERAMPAGGRFGGHFVSGHIDGTGRIVSLTQDDIATVMEVAVPADRKKYLVERGSIAIDGVSLTVSALTDSGFQVSLIPHTKAETILDLKKTGDRVNLEYDMIGKYVENMLKYETGSEKKESGVTAEFLAENGFL